MILHNGKWLKIEIIKSGKGQPFSWKPIQCPHRKSMAEMQYTGEGSGDAYNTTHYYITHFMQIFWLWFVIGIEIKQEKLSCGKYVPYDQTHFAAIDEILAP